MQMHQMGVPGEAMKADEGDMDEEDNDEVEIIPAFEDMDDENVGLTADQQYEEDQML